MVTVVLKVFAFLPDKVLDGQTKWRLYFGEHNK